MGSPGGAAAAVRRLMTEYRSLATNPIEGITAGPPDESDFFVWHCLLSGPEGTPYEGGVFAATMRFPCDYPLSPPSLRFTPPLLHPNVYKDGRVCISILHAPGEDPLQYESVAERWSPVQSVEKVLLSVMSLLSEPNLESPATVDAAKLYRDSRPLFNKRVRQSVLESLGLA